MKTCVFSDRIYKDTLEKSVNEYIINTIFKYNTAIRTAYKMVIDSEHYGKKFEKSLHLTLIDKFGYDNYYTNSILREAKSVYKSNVELWKLNISKKEDAIKNIENKIENTEKTITNKMKLVDSIVAISKVIKGNKIAKKPKKLPKFKTYRGAVEYLKDEENLIFAVRNNFKRTEVVYSMYEFEVCYLKPLIKRLKHKLKLLKYVLKRQNQKLAQMKKKPSFACFGTKAFFKKQFTVDAYVENHNLWVDEFDRRRNKSFQISGRKDAKQGNFVFRYNNSTLSFNSICGTEVKIPNVTFPYGKEHLDRALAATGKDRSAIAWEIEDKGDYYIIKAMVDLPKNESVNYSKADGIVGLDINYDHFALANIDKHGNLLGTKIIYFNIDSKTSNQITHILGNKIKEVFEYCKDLKKPLGMEDLDTEKSKNFLKYGNKRCNEKLTKFAYAKITQMIESRAYKDSIAIFKRKPAFTSQIGKLKYMKIKGVSVHAAAAYVVGRRCMNFREKVPNHYKRYLSLKVLSKRNWSHWSNLSSNLKSVYAKYFYQNINHNDFSTLPKLKEYLISENAIS